MKYIITSKDEIDKLPNDSQGNDIREMLSKPMTFGDSQYIVKKLIYDDGVNKSGKVEYFPTVEISAIFLSGPFKKE